MKKVNDPIPITTANGEVEAHAQVRVYVKELAIFVWAYVLDCDVAVLSLGMLCDEEFVTYNWVPNRPPTSVRMTLKSLPVTLVIMFLSSSLLL